MELIKDLYEDAAALFENITLPESELNEEIEDAVYRRWRLYAPVLEDTDEWESWFQEVCSENWPIAIALMNSAALIENPLHTMGLTTVTEGTDDLTDTLKVDRTREAADATSGYDNSTSESESSSTDTPGVVTTVTDQLGQTNTTTDTPGVTTTVKHSDTPQSAVTNLTDGYLSGVDQTSQSGFNTSAVVGSGTNTTTTTPTGSDTTEGSAEGSTARNYLDASSHNSTESEEHSGGTGREYGSTVTQTGFSGNQAQLLLEYRKTLSNIRRQVANLFHEAFLLVYLPFDESEE